MVHFCPRFMHGIQPAPSDAATLSCSPDAVLLSAPSPVVPLAALAELFFILSGVAAAPSSPSSPALPPVHLRPPPSSPHGAGRRGCGGGGAGAYGHPVGRPRHRHIPRLVAEAAGVPHPRVDHRVGVGGVGGGTRVGAGRPVRLARGRAVGDCVYVGCGRESYCCGALPYLFLCSSSFAFVIFQAGVAWEGGEGGRGGGVPTSSWHPPSLRPARPC